MQKVLDIIGGTLVGGLWLFLPVLVLVSFLTGFGAYCDDKGLDCLHYTLIATFLSPFVLSFFIQMIKLAFAGKSVIDQARTQKISGIIFILSALPVAAFFGFVIYIVSSFQQVENPIWRGVGVGLPILTFLVIKGYAKIKTAKESQNPANPQI